MTEAMFASVVDALTNNYTPALLSDAAAIEAITSLLQLTDVEHPEDCAVLGNSRVRLPTGTGRRPRAPTPLSSYTCVRHTDF